MTTQLTQRQASLAMMVASSVLLALMLAYTLFRSDFPLSADLLKLSTASVTVLTVFYWRRLEFIRSVFILASTLFIGFALPPEIVARSIAQAVLIPPIIALVMGGIRSIIGSTIIVWLILLLRMDLQGTLAPYGILVSALCVTGLVVGRLIMDTARRSAERQLAELRLSEERYRAISQLISDYAFAYSVDEQGKIQREWVAGASLQTLTGYHRDDLARITNPYALYQPADQVRAQSEIQAVLRGQTISSEYEIISKNGEKRWLYIRRLPIWNEDQTRVIRFYGAAQDITERKHAATELERLNEDLEARVSQRTAQLETLNADLEAFTYSVSHDLRAPLRAIETFTRAIEEHHAADLPDKARHYFERIQANVQRMNVLVEDLLQLSRTSRQPMRRETIDMNMLVEFVLTDLRAHADVTHVQFKVQTLPPGCADESLLQQVWINLLTNAIKYSSKVANPTLEIGYIIKGDQTAYFVKDNGAGFDPDYAHKLFVIFQRLHSDAEFDGTGIGLAIVKRIITRHGGQVWAEGQIGAGATFYFTLGSVATLNGCAET